jgi:hypothetical protein
MDSSRSGARWSWTDSLPASDYIFLVIVIAIIGGIAYAVKGASVQDGINKQKEAMKVCLMPATGICDYSFLQLFFK